MTAAAAPVGLIGRDQELDVLDRTLARAAARHRQLLLISGEQGVGKTALVEQFQRELAGRRTTLACVCTAERSAEVLAQDLIRQLRRTNPQAFSGLAAASRSRLTQLLETVEVSLTWSEQRFRVFDDIASLLRNIAGAGPLLVVVEEIQCADETTFKLIELLARELARLPVMLLLTERDDVHDRATSPAAELATRLLMLPESRRLKLRPLPFESAERLGHRLWSELPSPPAASREQFARDLAELSHGNPLFLRHLAHHWSLQPASSDTVPATLQAVMAARLARIDDRCRRLLAQAARLGREVEVGSLIRAATDSGQAEEATVAVVSCLEDAVRADLIEEVGGPVRRYRFRHPLLHLYLSSHVDTLS